jgi:AcrR family transcriptional regulator
MGTSERRDRDRQEMRRLIVDTATQILLDEGIDQVSIRRIADRIEYSPGTIYLYFEDKDDILYESHLEAFQSFYAAEMTVADVPDPLDRLKALGKVYVDFALANRRQYEMMFLIPVPRIQNKDKYDWSVSIKTYQVLRNIVQECIEKGLIRSGHPDVVAMQIWSTVHGLASLLIRERIPMIEKSLVATMTTPILEYLYASLRP